MAPHLVAADLPAMSVAALFDLDADHVEELLCRASLGVFLQRRMGFDMAPAHWEWCELVQTARRLCLIAPRDHGKSGVCSIGATVQDSLYQPKLWTYLFAATDDLAADLLARVWATMGEIAPWMTWGKEEPQKRLRCRFRNGATVWAAGALKAVRSAHPDVIRGDDILEDKRTRASEQRRKTHDWWFGAVSGMAHSGRSVTYRDPITRQVVTERIGPTRMTVVGTPFHLQDLLMACYRNPLYTYRRYAAEYDPRDLVPGTLAVEAS